MKINLKFVLQQNEDIWWWPNIMVPSQAIRQGLAMLMETSTFAKVTILYQLISNLAWMITLGRSPALIKSVESKERSRRHVGATYTAPVTFFILQQSYSPNPRTNFRANSSDDAVWCKVDHFEGWEMCSCEIWGCFTLKISRIKLSGMGNYQPK